MSYDVVMAVNHLVHITVDGENIVHSPFMATVEPATLAVGETLILLPPPPSTFSRCINSDGERASAK